MGIRDYLRLSYAETHDFSERRSVVGIILIVVICLVAGAIIVYANGKLTTCMATYQRSFLKAQVEEDKVGCEGATISVGQRLYGYSFTYVVTQAIDNYRNETLRCAIKKRGATIDLPSFAAPQFLWAYQISCTRPVNCCPEGIRGTPSEGASCFCNQTLELQIQDFGVGNSSSFGSAVGLVNGGSTSNAIMANYSNLNGTVSGIGIRTCPDNDSITVLRFDDTTYAAFSSSDICSGRDAAAGAAYQDPTIASAITKIRDSVDAAVNGDIPPVFMLPAITYLCFSCSRTRDLGQVLVSLIVAISAIGSVTYSVVLWLLKFTQSDRSRVSVLQLGTV